MTLDDRLGGLYGFGLWRLDHAVGPRAGAPMIRVVQANIDQKDKWRPENLEQIFATYLDLTRRRFFGAAAKSMSAGLGTLALASLLGAEGGHSIGCSMGVLRMMFTLGARYLTLVSSREGAEDNRPLGGAHPPVAVEAAFLWESSAAASPISIWGPKTSNPIINIEMESKS